MDRRTFLHAATAAVAGALAGCGGQATPTEAETPGGGMATPSPTSTPTMAGGQSAQEQYPDYNWSRLEGTEATATDTITMSGFEFDPLVAEITAGAEVTVTNEDSAGHTITVPAVGIDETVSGGASTTITVDRTGTFDYVCAFHPPDMLGRLVVTG